MPTESINIKGRTDALKALGMEYISNQDEWVKHGLFITVSDIEQLPKEQFTEIYRIVKKGIDLFEAEKQTEPQEIALINDNSLATFKNASVILASNKEIAAKAEAAGKALLSELSENNGQLNEDLDNKFNNYLVKLAQRGNEVNEARKPVTQLLTIIAKEFTTIEVIFDKTKPGTTGYLISQARNNYATQLLKEQKEREAAKAREQAKKDAEINITQQLTTQLSAFANNYLTAQKQSMNAQFNNARLDTIEAVKKYLLLSLCKLDVNKFSSFTANISQTTHSASELNAIIEKRKAEYIPGFEVVYKNEMEELRDMLVENLPGKKEELETIAQFEKENEEEAQRIKDEAKQREFEANEAIAKRNRELQAAAELQAKLASTVATTMNLFEGTSKVETTTAMPEMRAGYKIQVVNKVGFVEIFTLWWKTAGSELSNEKIIKTTIDQMVTHCEKMATGTKTKQPEMIISENITYSTAATAVNKK